MLDTNVTSAALRGDQVIKDRLTDLPPGSWCISAVTAAEHLYGLAKKPAAARLAELVHAFLEVAVVKPWDRTAASELGHLRAYLARDGQMIGAYDGLDRDRLDAYFASRLADRPALADAILSVGALKQEHCLRRANMFDQRERYCDYVSLYKQICGEGKA